MSVYRTIGPTLVVNLTVDPQLALIQYFIFKRKLYAQISLKYVDLSVILSLDWKLRTMLNYENK